MGKLFNKKGISRLEFITIIGIVICTIFVVFISVQALRGNMHNGDEGMLKNTAISAATMNLADGGCVVQGCNGGKCKHYNEAENLYVGYYDNIKSNIVESKPKGYNESQNPGTLVIQVSGIGDTVTAVWVKGDTEN